MCLLFLQAVALSAELKAAQEKLSQQEVIINSNIRQNEGMQQSLEESKTTCESLRHKLQRAQADAEALKEQLDKEKSVSDQLRNTIGELHDQNEELKQQAQSHTPSVSSYLTRECIQ